MKKLLLTIISILLFCTNLYALHLPKCPGEKRNFSTWVNCSGTDTGLDGHTYSGDFDSKGKYTGYGILKQPNDVLVYEGEFLNDKFHGKGKATNKHPTRGVYYYEGEWFMGNWHGKGVLWSEDGIFRYDGEFINGDMDGYGTLTYDGISKTGNFKHGELVD